MFRSQRIVLTFLLFTLLASFALAVDEVSTPFIGVTRIHRKLTTPRLLGINILIIDLNEPSISFRVTPARQNSESETYTQTVKNFLIEQNAQIAINAGFFYFNPNVDVMGFAASDGDNYSPFTSWYDFPTPHISLNISSDNQPAMVYPDTWVPAGYRIFPAGVEIYNAVPGSEWIVRHGIKNVGAYHLNPSLHPRTAAGFTDDNKLVLFTVDGRNTGHSLGMYTSEVADMLIDLGVVEGLNLDGGGSTTMAFSDPTPRLVNVPINGGVPYGERQTANNLAVFATYVEQQLTKLIFNDFEDADEGTFTYAPAYSGSTDGILASSTADAVNTDAFTNQWSQKILIADDPAKTAVSENPDGGWFVRMISGPTASPSQNISRPVQGYLGLWAKADTPDVYLSIAIDNENQMERGIPKLVPNDANWHLLQWQLTDDTQWQGWYNGDGSVAQTTFTLDSIQILGPDADAEIYIDRITHNPFGPIDQASTCQELWQLGQALPADLDHNCIVDYNDLKLMTQGWLSDDNTLNIAGIENPPSVDLVDYSAMVQSWLVNNDPQTQN
jgi:exopolysaccharide biosynthesis protein